MPRMSPARLILSTTRPTQFLDRRLLAVQQTRVEQGARDVQVAREPEVEVPLTLGRDGRGEVEDGIHGLGEQARKGLPEIARDRLDGRVIHQVGGGRGGSIGEHQARLGAAVLAGDPSLARRRMLDQLRLIETGFGLAED